MRALVVGGTSGIGHQIARTLAARGEEVVLTGRDAARAHAIASEIGAVHRGLALDLTRPQEISGQLSEVGAIDHLVLAAVERDRNSVRQYDVAAAVRAATLKIVGYTAVVSALVPRLTSAASIVVLGGLARDWPYPGSTTVSMVNGGVTSMVRTLIGPRARQRHTSGRSRRQPDHEGASAGAHRSGDRANANGAPRHDGGYCGGCSDAPG